ncbi:MAG: NUMOD3 domain-containing DNA-binding protein [Candidatus Heimdallarchaeaceae archaeon]
MKKLEEKLVCPICGEEKVFLGIHLKRVHSISAEEAEKQFGLTQLTAPALCERRKGKGNSFYGKHHTDETKNKMIQTRDGKSYEKYIAPLCKNGCGNKVKTPRYEFCQKCGCKSANSGEKNPAKRLDVREKISKGLAKVKEQRSQSISKAKTGIPRPDMLGENNPAKRPEVRAKLSLNNAMKRKEIVAKQIRSGCASPNYPERYLFNIIESLFPNEYALNPRGEVIRIGNKMPDFVNVNGQKKVIEHYGRRWHEPEDEPKRIQLFKEFGYDCLIIWNEEFKDLKTLKQKLIDFHMKKRFNDYNQNISNDEMVG